MPEGNRQSPEKDLLRLIEKPNSGRSLHATAAKYHSLSFFSFGALKARLAFFKSKFKGGFKSDARTLDLKTLNSLLALVIAVLLTYFIFNLSVSNSNLKKGLRPGINIDKVAVGSSGITSFLKAASYYLEKARGRDIFRMGIGQGGLADNSGRKETTSKITEATQHLQLVGIAWSDDPDVMIEDTRAKQTLFLKKGQLIENKIKVQAVFRDKVILSYQQEEIELK